MSQTVRPTPTKPSTTYETGTRPSDSHVVEDAEAMLDEIDALLAEEDEFLLAYQQKGGQ